MRQWMICREKKCLNLKLMKLLKMKLIPKKK